MRDQFIAAISLRSIEDYLRNSKKITVMHNADDIILEPGEIDFFSDVFGDRATIFPLGGHCGNMNYRDNVAAYGGHIYGRRGPAMKSILPHVATLVLTIAPVLAASARSRKHERELPRAGIHSQTTLRPDSADLTAVYDPWKMNKRI